MNVQTIFFAQGRLRAIWRFLFSALAIVASVIAIQILLGIVLGLAGTKPTFFLANSLTAFLTLPVLLGLVAFFTRVFEERPFGSAGMAMSGRWKAELALGLAIGTMMTLAVAGLEWALGAARFSWSGEELKLLCLWGGGSFVVLTFAATNEEIIFRGYPFQRLVESIGAPGAILILSVLFGAIHLSNPNSTWVGAANTSLVGVPFSIAYLRTRMLWLPIGMHFAWNFVLGFVLGLPVSGITFPVTLLRAEDAGPTVLTGGAYGPEAGLLATGVIVLATGYLAVSRSIYVSDDTRALLVGPAKTPAPEEASAHLEKPGPARGEMTS
ncbi:MAG: CPBP family intramembrane metalloprotease [Acidobacteria bacterium]|nr:CPBP family intramembrane metalloprotease [Acidobacteriota bacterium]